MTRFRTEFWWVIHNLIAHPLIPLTFNSRWSYWFHDWTAYQAI